MCFIIIIIIHLVQAIKNTTRLLERGGIQVSINKYKYTYVTKDLIFVKFVFKFIFHLLNKTKYNKMTMRWDAGIRSASLTSHQAQIFPHQTWNYQSELW